MPREDLPDSEERERKWQVDLRSPDLGLKFPLLRVAIGGRRDRRWGDFAEETAREGGVTVEDVIDRLSAPEDNDGVSLLERAVEEAVRTADRRKIKTLARVAAAAFSGDDAMNQSALLVLPAVIEIGPSHVRLMVEIEQRYGVEAIPLDRLFSTYLMIRRPSRHLVAQLFAKRILSLVVQPTPSDPPSAVTLYRMSAFGHQGLRYLGTSLDDGERLELGATQKMTDS